MMTKLLYTLVFFCSLCILQDVEFKVALTSPVTRIDTVWQCPPIATNMSVVNPKLLPVKELDVTRMKYIERFAPTAISEMKQFGIPASITLAQGCLESADGESGLATRGNNHFGIKCKVGKGNVCGNFKHSDGSLGNYMVYKSAWESYRAHSEFLQGKRYKPLQKHGKDYKKWAHGLKKAFYARDPKYAEKLINIIEDYSLYQFDKD